MKKILALLYIITLFVACSNDSGSDEIQPVNKAINRQTIGSSANDLLSDDKFTSLIIELVYVEGFKPTQETIDNFVTFISNRTFKPDGITIETRAIPSPGKDTYTIEEIADIEREQREQYNALDQIAVWILFIDGKSEKDTDNQVVLGTAYWNTSFVIYQETVQNSSNSPFEPSRSIVESTVINHEFGHILGLTNLGSPMQTEHEDTENPKHCDEEDCLMYWQSEISVGRFNMNTVPQLDSQCLADLKANGGK